MFKFLDDGLLRKREKTNKYTQKIKNILNISHAFSLFLQRRREECERKARRGEMDPRLEFTFQLLIDATGLPRNEIMDHVFEGDMVTFF